MNAFVQPLALCLLSVNLFVYDASHFVEVNELNYPPSAMLPLVPTFPSYEEFIEPSIGSQLSVLTDPHHDQSQNAMLADGGEYGEQGCAHLKGMPCDGKLETTIEKTYWMLYMSSFTKDRIDLDTVACVDRCVYDCCKAIKTKFTYSDVGCYAQDLWGTDGQYLIYLKQTLMAESQKTYIFRSKVQGIQKGTVDDQKNLSAVEKKDALTQILEGASFTVLGANFDLFIVLKSCSQSRPAVFVYVKEDAYLQSDDQKKQMLHDIDVILYNNKIDNRHLKFFKDRFPDSARVMGPGMGRHVGMGAGLNHGF